MKTPLVFAAFLALGFTSLSAQEKITYADHVRPLLENKCFSCHNPDKKKGDLDLTSFAATMAGGGGGSVINPGDPEGSKLIGTLTKKVEPYMPPEGSPLSVKEIDVLSKWIQGGVLDTASSIAKRSAPKANIALAVVSKGKPTGPLPMPENVLLEPTVTAPRATTISALAANPWSSLVAVGGLKQALVYDLATQTLAGVYPYPEGYLTSLKFSQNGALLVGGGGRGGKNGNAVVWDVKTGKRITEVGKEFDQVMCADISPNHAMVAIGSPSKKVKCYNASTGEELYIIKKHTEWVMQVAFSPDGVLLATADRNGGVIVSEAANGGEFYVLDGHKLSCTGLAWRSDGNLLASCSEDGKVSLWEMEQGKQVKSWAAHPSGCESVAFTPDGHIITAGRDGLIRLWDASGNKVAESKAQGDLVTKVAGAFDNKSVISGDYAGNVRLWSVDKFEELGTISSNPSPIAQRIVETEKRATEMVAQLPAVEAGVKQAEDTVKGKEAQVADAKKKAADAAAYRQKLEAEINAIPGQIDALKKAVAETQVKRLAQVDVLRKFEQDTARAKQLDPKVAALEKDYAALAAEAAKLTTPDQAPKKAEADQKAGAKKTELDAQKSQLVALKKAMATPPQPLSEFDKTLKSTQDQINALTAAKPNKTKELEGVRKSLDGWPKNIADAEKQLADARPLIAEAQAKLAAHKAEIAFLQKRPIFLRAAQFNVGLLSEKDKLAKIESDVTAYHDALKEADEAKTAAAQRIEDGKKGVAEAIAKLPPLQAAFAKESGELPAVEKILEPTQAAEAKTATLLLEQKKNLEQQQGAYAALVKLKEDRIAGAQKAVTDLSGQIAAMLKQSAEIGKKADPLLKAADSKKTAFTQADTDWNASKQRLAAAQEDARKKAEDSKTKDATVAKVHGAQVVAQKALDDLHQQERPLAGDAKRKSAVVDQLTKDLAAAQQANQAAQLPALQKSLDEAKAAAAAATKSAAEIAAKVAAADKAAKDQQEAQATAQKLAEASQQAVKQAQTALAQAGKQADNFQVSQTRTKQEWDTAEKAASPLREQLRSLTAQVEALKQTIAQKQAEPAAAEQEFAAKSKSPQDAIAQTKTAMAPLEKQLAEIRAKLAADLKTVEAKRALVAKAKVDLDAVVKDQTDHQKKIESSQKEIADKDKSITDMKGDLAKLEPQLEPQRSKVKQMTDSYVAMLPK